MRAAASLLALLAAVSSASSAAAAPSAARAAPGAPPAPAPTTPTTPTAPLLLEGLGDGGAGAAGQARRWIEIAMFKGFVSSEARLYVASSRGDARRGQLIQTLRATLDLRLFSRLEIYLRPRFLIDALDVDLRRYEPLEAYLAVGGRRWSLRAGLFVDNWGVADALNPLDVLNRKDYGADMIDPLRLGELGARLRVHLPGGKIFGQPALSLYVMPLVRDAELPTSRSRFNIAVGGLELARSADKPDAARSILAALRLEHTLETPLFRGDFQYIVARGPDRFPNVVIGRDASGAPQLRPELYGSLTFGGGFRVVPNADWWSKLTLKLEVAYRRPYALRDGQALPDDYLQLVFGVDRAINGLFARNDELLITLEYLGESLAHDTLARLRPFEHDVALRLLWRAKNFARSTVELRAIVDVTDGESIFEASYQQQLRFIHDNLRVALRGQAFVPRRDDSSFFSLLSNNTNLRAELRLSF